MGIDAHFFVKTDRDLTQVFDDMWWKTRAENFDDKIYVNKVPGGYHWYNLDRWYHREYRRGYMPRLYIMYKVMNQNLVGGEAIYYTTDHEADPDFLTRRGGDQATTHWEMLGLLDDWIANMGIHHWNPEIRWNTEHPPSGCEHWDRTPKVVWRADADDG